MDIRNQIPRGQQHMAFIALITRHHLQDGLEFNIGDDVPVKWLNHGILGSHHQQLPFT
jgi:hypothetical protein